jgi:D-inositol-3-phosphate glycosyltransferase
MVKNKLGIIDHVGNKSGMDYYDISLSRALATSFQVTILSNFEIKEPPTEDVKALKTFLYKGDGVIEKIRYFFMGFLRSFYFAKKLSIKTILFHSFSFEYKDLIVLFLAKFLNFEILLIVHDVSGFAENDKKKVKHLVLRRFANFILVHNEFSKKEILKNHVDNNKIITISLGGYIDQVQLLPRKKAINKLQLSEDFRYVLFFGQIKQVKGLDILIQSFSKLQQNNLKLVIAGKVWNDDACKYIELIKNLGINNKVLLYERFITDQERDLFFSIADVVVLPYRQIYQSGVLMTAMSYPSIVICSDLEPNKEVIQNNINGFLFKSEDIINLTKILKEVLDLDNITIENIKQEALTTVKEQSSWKFSAEQIFKKLIPNG